MSRQFSSLVGAFAKKMVPALMLTFSVLGMASLKPFQILTGFQLMKVFF